MHPADAEVDGIQESGTSLAFREDMQRFACLLAVKAGALNRLLDSVMAKHERKRLVEIRVFDGAVLQGAPPEGAFFRSASSIGEHDRQRYLAFPEIVADALAKP